MKSKAIAIISIIAVLLSFWVGYHNGYMAGENEAFNKALKVIESTIK